MDYDYHEAMKLVNQLCFPLYAAARNVTGLYTPYLKPLGLTYVTDRNEMEECGYDYSSQKLETLFSFSGSERIS